MDAVVLICSYSSYIIYPAHGSYFDKLFPHDCFGYTVHPFNRTGTSRPWVPSYTLNNYDQSFVVGYLGQADGETGRCVKQILRC